MLYNGRAPEPQAKQPHTTAASYASRWGKTKKIKFEVKKIM
jgi:hypothetical protein